MKIEHYDWNLPMTSLPFLFPFLLFGGILAMLMAYSCFYTQEFLLVMHGVHWGCNELNQGWLVQGQHLSYYTTSSTPIIDFKAEKTFQLILIIIDIRVHICSFTVAPALKKSDGV